ncbi:unnamed protein product [Brachionus calyciflorus]|uniref:Proteasome assembly chaperone 3 n=1 Tax=Brachionus calyciflorus TaxID=104777 RepID=A0A814E9B3_9BILA|nr:unnamed protein product [Brachionus calyciflorus]
MTDVELSDIELRLKKYSIENQNLLKFKKLVKIDSTNVDLICIDYSDKLFLSISTNDRFGSVLFAKSEKVSGLAERIFTIKQLFGQSEITLEVFSRSLAEKLYKLFSIEKPILLSIGIKKDQLENLNLFKAIEKNILELFRD